MTTVGQQTVQWETGSVINKEHINLALYFIETFDALKSLDINTLNGKETFLVYFKLQY